MVSIADIFIFNSSCWCSYSGFLETRKRVEVVDFFIEVLYIVSMSNQVSKNNLMRLEAVERLEAGELVYFNFNPLYWFSKDDRVRFSFTKLKNEDFWRVRKIN